MMSASCVWRAATRVVASGIATKESGVPQTRLPTGKKYYIAQWFLHRKNRWVRNPSSLAGEGWVSGIKKDVGFFEAFLKRKRLTSL